MILGKVVAFVSLVASAWALAVQHEPMFDEKMVFVKTSVLVPHLVDLDHSSIFSAVGCAGLIYASPTCGMTHLAWRRQGAESPHLPSVLIQHLQEHLTEQDYSRGLERISSRGCAAWRYVIWLSEPVEAGRPEGVSGNPPLV